MSKPKPLPASEDTVKGLRSLFENLMALPGAYPDRERLEERQRLYEKFKKLGLSLYDLPEGGIYCSESAVKEFFEI